MARCYVVFRFDDFARTDARAIEKRPAVVLRSSDRHMSACSVASASAKGWRDSETHGNKTEFGVQLIL